MNRGDDDKRKTKRNHDEAGGKIFASMKEKG